MQDIIAELDYLEVGTTKRPANFLIQGGYFEVGRGPDEFSKSSLSKAIELGKALQARNSSNCIKHDILINDIGLLCKDVNCDTDRANNKATFNVEDYENIKNNFLTKRIEITATTERHMRNRGLRHIKKILRSQDIEGPHDRLHPKNINNRRQWLLKSTKFDRILLFEEIETSLIAKCPVIMGSYYSYLWDKKLKSMDDSKEIVIIDLCGFNDKEKVAKGAETAFALFNPKPDRRYVIMPVLCSSNCDVMLPTLFQHPEKAW